MIQEYEGRLGGYGRAMRDRWLARRRKLVGGHDR